MSTETQQPNDLYEAGWKARLVDDRFRAAHELFLRSLEAAWRQGDRQAGARALLALGNNLLWYCPPELENSELTSIDDLFEEALEICRQAEDESGVARSLRALDRVDESLEICRRIADRSGIVRALARQAILAAVAKGKHRVTAPQHATSAVELARTLNDPELLAEALHAAAVCWPEEESGFRRQLFLEAAKIYGEIKYVRDAATALSFCALIACDDDLELQERLYEQAAELWHSLERYESEKNCVLSIAELAEKRNDTRRAVELRERASQLEGLPEPD